MIFIYHNFSAQILPTDFSTVDSDYIKNCHHNMLSEKFSALFKDIVKYRQYDKNTAETKPGVCNSVSATDKYGILQKIFVIMKKILYELKND